MFKTLNSYSPYFIRIKHRTNHFNLNCYYLPCVALHYCSSTNQSFWQHRFDIVVKSAIIHFPLFIYCGKFGCFSYWKEQTVFVDKQNRKLFTTEPKKIVIFGKIKKNKQNKLNLHKITGKWLCWIISRQINKNNGSDTN